MRNNKSITLVIANNNSSGNCKRSVQFTSEVVVALLYQFLYSPNRHHVFILTFLLCVQFSPLSRPLGPDVRLCHGRDRRADAPHNHPVPQVE